MYECATCGVRVANLPAVWYEKVDDESEELAISALLKVLNAQLKDSELGIDPFQERTATVKVAISCPFQECSGSFDVEVEICVATVPNIADISCRVNKSEGMYKCATCEVLIAELPVPWYDDVDDVTKGLAIAALSKDSDPGFTQEEYFYAQYREKTIDLAIPCLMDFFNSKCSGEIDVTVEVSVVMTVPLVVEPSDIKVLRCCVKKEEEDVEEQLAALHLSDVKLGLFSTQPTTQPTVPDHPRNALIKLLKSAKKTVDAALYCINDDGFRQQLIDCLSNKIEVRIIADTSQYYKEFEQRENPMTTLIDDIESKGANVNLLKGSGKFGQMHHKFWIVDNQLVAHGSYNPTNNAREHNYEALCIGNLHTEYFKCLFDQLWAEGSRSST